MDEHADENAVIRTRDQILMAKSMERSTFMVDRRGLAIGRLLMWHAEPSSALTLP